MTREQLNILRICAASFEMINGAINFVLQHNIYLFCWFLALVLYGMAMLPDQYNEDDLI